MLQLKGHLWRATSVATVCFKGIARLSTIYGGAVGVSRFEFSIRLVDHDGVRDFNYPLLGTCSTW